MVNNVNDHLYKTVVYRLNQRLNNLSGEDESKLIKDYLSLTKEILSDLLAQYGLNHRLAPLLAKRYDYKQKYDQILAELAHHRTKKWGCLAASSSAINDLKIMSTNY